MTKNIIFILSTVFLVLFQISFVHEFYFFRSNINIVLLAVVFLAVMSNSRRSLSFAILAGIMLDIYSPFTFGINTLALVIPVFLIHNVFRKLLTRKSLISTIIVMAMSVAVYHGVLLFLSTLFFWLGWRDISASIAPEYLLLVINQILWHSAAISLLFLLMRMISQKIKLNFLINENV
ncbi:rod shape-determining protein MreD [Patescibacteria group bacterium]|nr:rod shape-determining protein MreD [Patescibacteria group bacterium]